MFCLNLSVCHILDVIFSVCHVLLAGGGSWRGQGAGSKPSPVREAPLFGSKVTIPPPEELEFRASCTLKLCFFIYCCCQLVGKVE